MLFVLREMIEPQLRLLLTPLARNTKSVEILKLQGKKPALLHPIAALSFVRGDKHRMHEVLILKSASFLFGKRTEVGPWRKAITEIINGDLVPMNVNGPIPAGNTLNTTLGKWIYCAVRVLKPDVMIETGVASGVSSWLILNAMHKNRKGTLYSIDLPNADLNSHYNNLSETGWVVPRMLRDRWVLKLGSACELLPSLQGELGRCDLFFHDSDHSYEHMTFEFNAVFPFLKQGGLLISDDINNNAAFNDFLQARDLRGVVFNKGGCTVKV